MTPHKQRFRHDPENGVYGDCWRTAIACLLDLDPEEVPHFNDSLDKSGDDVRMETMEWLSWRALTYITIGWPGELSIKDVLTSVGIQNPHVFYLFSGESRTGVNHTVIGRGDAIIHDPSLDNSGIVGPCDNGNYYTEFLAPTLILAANEHPVRSVVDMPGG